MEKLINNHCHFPDPETSIVTLIMSDWREARIKMLQGKPQTDAVKKSLKRVTSAIVNQMLMEPPFIMDNNTMKVCLISRAAGTLWYDEIVNKLQWPRFLKKIDPNGDFGKLETKTPGVITKDDLMELAKNLNYTADEPTVYLSDIEGSDEKALIFVAKDSTITPEIFTQSFLKGYRFCNLTVEIKNKGDEGYPTIDGDVLDMSIGTFEIVEELLVEGTVKYRVFSLPTLNGIINNNDTTVYNGVAVHNGFIKY